MIIYSSFVFFIIASLALRALCLPKGIFSINACRVYMLNVGSSPDFIFLGCLAVPFPWALHPGFYHRDTPLHVDSGLPTVPPGHTPSEWPCALYFLPILSLPTLCCPGPNKPDYVRNSYFLNFS